VANSEFGADGGRILGSPYRPARTAPKCGQWPPFWQDVSVGVWLPVLFGLLSLAYVFN